MSNYRNKKHGFNNIDMLQLGLIIIMMIIYIVCINENEKLPSSNSPSSNSPSSNSQSNNSNVSKNNEVSGFDIFLSIWGFILGLFISSFITRFLFREYNKNITIIILTFIISIILLILYYIASNYVQNDNTNNTWTKYNQYIFPLVGGLLLISEDAINHIFDYMGNEGEYEYIDVSKIARSLSMVRDKLDDHGILSDTSTDYKIEENSSDENPSSSPIENSSDENSSISDDISSSSSSSE